jgi:hypothetical protein
MGLDGGFLYPGRKNEIKTAVSSGRVGKQKGHPEQFRTALITIKKR